MVPNSPTLFPIQRCALKASNKIWRYKVQAADWAASEMWVNSKLVVETASTNKELNSLTLLIPFQIHQNTKNKKWWIETVKHKHSSVELLFSKNSFAIALNSYLCDFKYENQIDCTSFRCVTLSLLLIKNICRYDSCSSIEKLVSE